MPINSLIATRMTGCTSSYSKRRKIWVIRCRILLLRFELSVSAKCLQKYSSALRSSTVCFVVSHCFSVASSQPAPCDLQTSSYVVCRP